MKNFYINLPDNKIEIVTFLFWTTVAYALFSWFSIQIHTSITADTLWLCDAAGRLLSGQNMADAYYDPHPPLSVLLYVLPVLASMTGLIPVYHAVFGYVLLILAGSAWLTYRILKSVPGIDHTTVMTATVALVMANTILPSISFTERDQILGILLLPFVLAQIGITKKWPMPRLLKHIALCAGALIILVKPHHGLLPTLILLHRMIRQRRISVWKDADFLYLSGAVLTYTVILFIYFSDYLHIILPDVINLYIAAPSKFTIIRSVYYGMLCTAGLLLAIVLNNKSWISYFLFTAALVSLIPYIVQMRGYTYHLLPAVTFFWCGVAVLSKETLQKFMAPHLSMVLVTFVMTAVAFSASTVRVYFPTHEKYQELPLAKFLESCEAPCPVFVLNDHIEITHQTALYSHKPWASRFPSFWFMPGIMSSSPDDVEKYREKYGQMIAEDLARYQPKILLIGGFKVTNGDTFDFFDFFGNIDAVKQELAHYRKKDDFTMDQRVYFTGTNLDKPRPMTYKFYERIQD